jgi:hypothetical protein
VASVINVAKVAAEAVLRAAAARPWLGERHLPQTPRARAGWRRDGRAAWAVLAPPKLRHTQAGRPDPRFRAAVMPPRLIKWIFSNYH